MSACYVEGHEPVPEDAAKLQGPELGLAVYHDRYGPKRDEPEYVVVEVVARSYVWSPEQHRPDGYHGFRHYDWSVIDRGRRGRLVVNDEDVSALTIGAAVPA